MNTSTLNRLDLAELFCRNVTTIDLWIRQGMPYVKKGSKGINWEFDLKEVLKWRESKLEEAAINIDNVEYEEAKRRKIAAEAGLLELDLQKKRGEIITRQEVEKGLSQAYIAIKQRLRTIPERIVPQIISETNEAVCNELLLYEIDDALLELSQLKFYASITEQSEEIPSTTAEADGF